MKGHNMEALKIKIIVGIDEDGNEEEREVNIDQAIAFLKNQLEGLEALKRQKKELDLERAEKLLKEAQEEMRKAQGQQTDQSTPWDNNPPYIPGKPIWIWNDPYTTGGNITWSDTTTTYTNNSSDTFTLNCTVS